MPSYSRENREIQPQVITGCMIPASLHSPRRAGRRHDLRQPQVAQNPYGHIVAIDQQLPVSLAHGVLLPRESVDPEEQRELRTC